MIESGFMLNNTIIYICVSIILGILSIYLLAIMTILREKKGIVYSIRESQGLINSVLLNIHK